jgi:hypothetical protein
MPDQTLFMPLSVAACAVDRALESAMPSMLSAVFRNLIAVGSKR